MVDYVSTIQFYQSNDIPIWKFATAGHFAGGRFVILELGMVILGHCRQVSWPAGCEQLASFVRNQGWDAILVPTSRNSRIWIGYFSIGRKALCNMLRCIRSVTYTSHRGVWFSFVEVPYSEVKKI